MHVRRSFSFKCSTSGLFLLQVHQLARALQRCTSQGQVATSGPGIAADPRPCLICGISCLVYVTVPGISAPLAPQPSLAASVTTGAAVSAAIAQVFRFTPAKPNLQQGRA